MHHEMNKASSTGIDDFLLNYKHHQSSIQDFMSCLDDPFTASLGVGALDKTWELTFYGKGATSSSEVDFDSDSSGRESKKSKLGTASRQVTRRTLQPKKTIDRKQALTAEEKDGRRRFQNREAQRRFRERHMLEAYRNASANLQTRLLGWLRIKQPAVF